MTKKGKEKKKGGKLKIILIVVAVIIVIAVVGSMGGGDTNSDNDQTAQTNQTQTDEPTTEPEESETAELEVTTYDGGMYKVGTDLPAGEYLIESDTMDYMEVANDSTGELDSIVTNENYTNRVYVTVSDGQYLKFGGTATPVSEAPAYQSENGAYPEGQYLVGKDIPAGEYKISVLSDNITGYGYVEVSSDSSGNLDSIVSNSNIEADTYQTISDGQYLTLSGCEIKGQ